jgi:23S rRNA (uracil1939-C5)-methyltransferase
MTDSECVVVDRIGGRGDGIARLGDRELFVPFALPGEQWCVEDGIVTDRLTDSPDRREGICPHFGICGGCAMQHLEMSAYRSWKRNLVVEAFQRAGLADVVGELAVVPLASRRRAVLTARIHKGGCAIGFHEARSHRVVDMIQCPILDPRILGSMADLRRLAELLAVGPEPVRVTVLATDTGLDVNVEDFATTVSATQRKELATLAEEADWARLTAGGEAVVMRHTPQLSLDGVRVTPPPAGFVQAVGAAEATMQSLAVEAAGRAKNVADLFAGIGTLAIPLARKARVLAVDSDRAALAALDAGLRGAQGLKPVETRLRDLFREPLSRKELEPFDCVVFDPPRAGARAQAEMLAKSKVPVVAAVSCNPSTLARDLKILCDGGYVLERAVPIDQFMFSHHVEVVAVLRRKSRR